MTNTEKRKGLIKRLGKLIDFASNLGIEFLITSFNRSAEEQKQLFDEGKSACDGYNKKSNHQLWLAFDIVIIKGNEPVWWHTKDYDELGSYWIELGGTWGGTFSNLDDIFHFEYNPKE